MRKGQGRCRDATRDLGRQFLGDLAAQVERANNGQLAASYRRELAQSLMAKGDSSQVAAGHDAPLEPWGDYRASGLSRGALMQNVHTPMSWTAHAGHVASVSSRTTPLGFRYPLAGEFVFSMDVLEDGGAGRFGYAGLTFDSTERDERGRPAPLRQSRARP